MVTAKKADEFKELEPSDEILEPDESLKELYRKLRLARQKEFFAKLDVSNFESAIKAKIGSCSGIRGIASWKMSNTRRVDSNLLKQKHPDIYEECSKVSSFRRFKLE